MGKPKTFELKNGSKVEVHTPFTTRAKELQQLYNGLNLPALSVDERLDVLLHVKWTVKEFDCALTREIVELIDREADLLNRCARAHAGGGGSLCGTFHMRHAALVLRRLRLWGPKERTQRRCVFGMWVNSSAQLSLSLCL